jgi:hypothetical protein
MLRARWVALGCGGLAGATAVPASITAVFLIAYGFAHSRPPVMEGSLAWVGSLVVVLASVATPPLLAVGTVALLSAREHRSRAALLGTGVFLALLGAVFIAARLT